MTDRINRDWFQRHQAWHRPHDESWGEPAIQTEPHVYALAWWTLPDGQLVGVAALVDAQHGYWKAYMGVLPYASVEARDAARIVATGVPAGEPVARALAGARFDPLELRAT